MSTFFRNAVFTINNYTPELIIKLLEPNEKIQYITFQEEIAPTTLTPHLQGYIELNKAQRLSAYKKILTNIAHIEPRRGTQQQAIDYAHKTETRREGTQYYEQGEIKQQGERNDLKHIGRMIQQNTSLTEIAQLHPDMYIKYSKGFKELQRVSHKPRDFKSIVTILYGDSNTGKTQYVQQFAKDNNLQVYTYTNTHKANTSIFFDGYENQDILLLDEFSGYLPQSFYKQLLDKYAFELPIKGGSKQFTSKYIFIISNKSPQLWYPNATKQDTIAIWRRYDSIKQYTINNNIINIEDQTDYYKSQYLTPIINIDFTKTTYSIKHIKQNEILTLFEEDNFNAIEADDEYYTETSLD